MADQDGGIMQKIQAITAPPHPSPTSKQRRGKTKPPANAYTMSRQSGVDNHAYCDACGDGGGLLCCERCPASFHFICCDPPLDPLNLPEGEWVCNSCRPSPSNVEGHKNALFHSLLVQACSENPLVFSLPGDMISITLKDMKQDKRAKPDNSISTTFCYLCDRSSRHGTIVNCSFCPLSYHMDCLDPPLTHSPLSSSWMCPNHVEHSKLDLHSIRLSERVKALEECRVDISHHSIKMDFLDKLSHIPHYKRITARTNRRTMEVPEAIKSLYSHPLEDAQQANPLTQLLLTATEQLEILRREGERERRDLQLSSSFALTEEQDEWTRHKVLESVGTRSQAKTTTLEDLREILGTSSKSGRDMICNGHVDQPLMAESKSSNKIETGNTLGGNSKPSLLSSNQQTLNFPDIDSLDEKLIRLLATQRLQQLLSAKDCSRHKHLNGIRQAPPPPPPANPGKTAKRKREFDPRSSIAILCPLSNVGPVVPLNTSVITIGSGSEMDVCLSSYGHCNYISPHHACIIIDKESEEFELINYSDHGSIVDGVLYSCDFSTKSTDGTVLLLDDVIAQGEGRRAQNAKRRLEYARSNLRDKEKAKKALSAAMKMNKSINRDCVIDPSQLTGIKRTRSNSTSSDPSSPGGSSIASLQSKKSKTPPVVDPRAGDQPKLETDSMTTASQGGGGGHHSSKETPPFSRPCLCKRSASSLIGNNGKGWEGAALISHGSKLRFGCIQLCLSISNRPGHLELLQSLFDAHLL